MNDSNLGETLETAIQALVGRIAADSARDWAGIIQLLVSGGVKMEVSLEVSAEAVRRSNGRHPKPDLTLSIPAPMLLAILSGNLQFKDPDALQGLEVDGDIAILDALFGYLVNWSAKDAPFKLAAETTRRQTPITKLEQVEYPGEGEVRAALAAYRPMLIGGAFSRWPLACKAWTAAGLVRDFGDVLIGVSGMPTALSTFVANADAAPASTNLQLPKRMADAAGAPGYFRPEDWYHPYCFLSSRGNLTPVHRDVPHNFAIHVFGRKRWLLFPPHAAEALYAHNSPADGPLAQFCDVDLDAPDYVRFPKLRDVSPIEVVVEAGQILLVPSGWFHQVYSLELALNVAFFLKWQKGFEGELACDTTFVGAANSFVEQGAA